MSNRPASDDPSDANPEDASATPVLTVSASRRSLWLGPASIVGMGIAGVVLASLEISGTLPPITRSHRTPSPVLALACGLGVIGLGLVAIARAWSSKGTLIVVDRHHMRIQTLRRVVEVHLDQVEYVTTVKKHGVRSLAVGDADGRIHRPILHPDGHAWDVVADRLNELLAEHRTRRRSSHGDEPDAPGA